MCSWASGQLHGSRAAWLARPPASGSRQFCRRDRGTQENFPNIIICDESARTATAVGSWAVVSFGLARPTGVDRPRRHDLGLQCARCRLRGGVARVASRGMGSSLRQAGARSAGQFRSAVIDSSDDGGASWAHSPSWRRLSCDQFPLPRFQGAARDGSPNQ